MNELWPKVVENVRGAELSFDNGLYNLAAGRAYYAMFTAARVLLNELAGFAYEDVRRHRAVMRHFSAQFIRSGRLDANLGQAFLRSSHLRGTADYDAQSVSRDEAEAAITTMRDFIAAAEKLLAK